MGNTARQTLSWLWPGGCVRISSPSINTEKFDCGLGGRNGDKRQHGRWALCTHLIAFHYLADNGNPRRGMKALQLFLLGLKCTVLMWLCLRCAETNSESHLMACFASRGILMRGSAIRRDQKLGEKETHTWTLHTHVRVHEYWKWSRQTSCTHMAASWPCGGVHCQKYRNMHTYTHRCLRNLNWSLEKQAGKYIRFGCR